MSKKSIQYVRVGAFVAIALSVLIATVFVIGQEHSLFSAKTRLYTSFADVNGLVIGAPVRLAGVDVGRVTAVEFSSDLRRPEARIQLAIEDRYMDRVRRDSYALIDSKGLLGDKIINVTVGDPQRPRLREGEYIEPKSGPSFESLAKQMESTASAIGDAAHEAQGAVGNLASPEVVENLRRSSDALATILEEVAHGKGLMHQLVFEPAYAEDTSAMFTNLAEASKSLRAAGGRVDHVLARVEHGPGTLNALVYGEDGAAALADARHAAAGVAAAADQLDHGPGLLHALLRDEAGAALVRDVAQLADRLNRISHDVERGRGTLGGLIVDPSVYEEMKTVLGNIERSVVFKALVRATIKNNGIARPAVQVEPVR